MAKLIFISGSIRKASFNKKLVLLALEYAKEAGADAKYIDLADFEMPIYNGDLEAEKGLPEGAIRLKKEFMAADGIFFASPEYNKFISPLLKNSLDWISRPGGIENEKSMAAYAGKVAAIAAASPSNYGGIRGLIPLRAMLGQNSMTVIPEQVEVHFADKAFDENGKFIDEKYTKHLKNLVKSLNETADRLKK